MRAIKRESLPLNAGKRQRVQAVALAYGREKQQWIDYFQRHPERLASWRTVRDECRAEGYVSPYGLPSVQWAMALKDATS